MNKTVSIEIPVEVLENRIADALNAAGEKHAVLTAHVIVEHLSKSDAGIEQVCLAFMGHQIKIPYVIGDEVMVTADKLSNYLWDKDEMIKQGRLVNNEIKCKIENITQYSIYHLYVKYEYVRKEKTGEFTVQFSSNSVRVSDVRVGLGCNLTRPDMGDLI